MEKMELGGTGTAVSRVAFGCMKMGTTIPEDRAFALLDRFADAGGDFLDTANCYAWWTGKGEFVGDESEEVVGAWMRSRKSRGKTFVATKIGARPREGSSYRMQDGSIDWGAFPAAYEGLSRDAVVRAAEGSLRRLGIDRIDLLYAHIDDRAAPQEETLEALDSLVRAGKVRYVGCSNFRTWRIERARSLAAARGLPRFVAVQQQYTYLRPRPGADFGIDVHADDELFDYAAAEGDLSVLAYSPLLSGAYADQRKWESYWNRDKFDGDDARGRLAALAAVSRRTGAPANAVVLAWMLARKPAVIPVFGSSGEAQLEESLRALDLRLDAQALAELGA